jgi:hypothetical protein
MAKFSPLSAGPDARPARSFFALYVVRFRNGDRTHAGKNHAGGGRHPDLPL